jgi:PDZ domain
MMIWPVRLPLALALAFSALSTTSARAEMPPQLKEQATLFVEGVVRQTFRSVRATRIDYLFEIQVRSARAGGSPETPFEGTLPKPGDLVYALAFQRRRDAPRVPGPVGYLTLPAEQDLIRAYLYPRSGGGWQLAYPLGFERLGRGEGGPGPEPTDFRPVPDPGAVPPRRIGVVLLPVALGKGSGLQVTEVTPGGPARRAGLEPGDLILEADHVPTRTLADLTDQIARAGSTLHLLIRNVRTGQIQPLEVDLGGPL